MIKKLLFCLSYCLVLVPALAKAQSTEPLFKVHHLALSVNNIESMKTWYTNVLGCKVVSETENSQTKYLRINLDGFLIDMLQVKGSHRQPSQDMSFKDHMNAQGFRHLVLVAPNLKKAYDTLKAKGVVFYNDGDINKKNVSQHLLLKDPEGNIIGLSGED